jgi:hypothetical protein
MDLDGLIYRNVFLTFLKARLSKIKVLADLMSGEVLWLDCK